MHLLLMTRGIYHFHELWKTLMQGQLFTWRRQPLLRDEKGEFIKNPDGTYKRGEIQLTKVQGSLRPIQLFEYIFPREGVQMVNGKFVPSDNLKEVLAMMNLHKNYNKQRKEIQNYAWMLRKLTGFKKIPDMPELQKEDAQNVTFKDVPINQMGMAVYPIGIREDITQDYIFDIGHGKKEGWYQEGI